MPEVITMPKFGLTMTEGNVLNWLKQEGEQVKKGEPLFEVETDKITNEVEAPVNGYIRKIFINEGYEIPCGEPIAIIGDKDEDISYLEEGAPSVKQEEHAVELEQQNSRTNEQNQLNTNAQKANYDVLATPMARNLARKQNIELAQVTGTGPSGVVTSKDITKSKGPSMSPMAKKWAEENNVDISEIKSDKRILLPDVIAAKLAKSQSVKSVNDDVPSEPHPLTGMRKTIAQRMSQSWTEIPHVTLNKEIDVSELLSVLKDVKSIGQEKDVKITLTHILIQILGDILQKHPNLNAWFDDRGITQHSQVNIGVATALDNGLIVPVIKNVNKKQLVQIAKETSDLIKAAKENNLVSSDLQSGTFTITNLGMFGIDSFTPIINRPQTGILGVNKITKKPVFVNDQIEKRSFITFSLSFDHRVVDGAEGAFFLQELEKYLQQPLRLVMGM